MVIGWIEQLSAAVKSFRNANETKLASPTKPKHDLESSIAYNVELT